VGFIAGHDDSYSIKYDGDWTILLIGYLTAAITVTFTLSYFIFYSISYEVETGMQYIELLLKYNMFYTLACLWILAELDGASPIMVSSKLAVYELFLYLTVTISLIILVILFYDGMRSPAFWITFIYFSLVLIIDFFAFATHEQVKNFYLPMVIMLSVVTIAGLFVFFHVPERWCEETRVC